MQGVNGVPRIRQILGGGKGLKDVPLEQEVGVEAGFLEPVHGGHEFTAAIGGQAVACHLSEGTLAFNQAPRLVALEGIVTRDERSLLRLQAVRS